MGGTNNEFDDFLSVEKPPLNIEAKFYYTQNKINIYTRDGKNIIN